MERNVAALLLLLAAWTNPAAAQTAGPPLDATQTAGRNLFAQHCVVCHVKTLVTAVRTYGPSLSKESIGGLDDVLAAFISTGTSNMPGFKYSLEPGEIASIVAYLKTLPAPPAAPASPASR
ncbi:MAG TPA: cytochrome c [Xanthobacteraceae bacterium]|jgi:mono/diheme cytochrome c family protein|nr:cytochrome c [Xanthobacteraceae bacterium]